jgi:hypothetical protein
MSDGAAYIDLSESGIEAWLRAYGADYAAALGIELVEGLKESLDPGPGPRTGEQYYVPGTRTLYTASAPGEHPAVREGVLRDSWKPLPVAIDDSSVTAGAGSDLRTEGGHYLAQVLNDGTADGRIGPRPFISNTLDQLAARWGAEVVHGDGEG